MPEEGRRFEYVEVVTFFLEIDLAAGDITETVGRRSEDRRAGREFDTPVLNYIYLSFDKINFKVYYLITGTAEKSKAASNVPGCVTKKRATSFCDLASKYALRISTISN